MHDLIVSGFTSGLISGLSFAFIGYTIGLGQNLLREFGRG